MGYIVYYEQRFLWCFYASNVLEWKCIKMDKRAEASEETKKKQRGWSKAEGDAKMKFQFRKNHFAIRPDKTLHFIIYSIYGVKVKFRMVNYASGKEEKWKFPSEQSMLKRERGAIVKNRKMIKYSFIHDWTNKLSNDEKWVKGLKPWRKCLRGNSPFWIDQTAGACPDFTRQKKRSKDRYEWNVNFLTQNSHIIWSSCTKCGRAPW